MTKVRNMAKTTGTLVAFAVGLALLTHFCKTLSGDFFYKVDMLLDSKSIIGNFHSTLIRLSFWLMLIASGIEAVYCEKTGKEAIGSFAAPIVLSCYVAAWGVAAMVTQVNILWFWLFYYIGLLICIRVSYGRLSYVRGSGPSDIKQLLHTPPNKYSNDVSIIDRNVLFEAKVVLLFDWFALWIAVIVFCIQNKQIFGL